MSTTLPKRNRSCIFEKNIKHQSPLNLNCCRRGLVMVGWPAIQLQAVPLWSLAKWVCWKNQTERPGVSAIFIKTTACGTAPYLPRESFLGVIRVIIIKENTHWKKQSLHSIPAVFTIKTWNCKNWIAKQQNRIPHYSPSILISGHLCISRLHLFLWATWHFRALPGKSNKEIEKNCSQIWSAYRSRFCPSRKVPLRFFTTGPVLRKNVRNGHLDDPT